MKKRTLAQMILTISIILTIFIMSYGTAFAAVNPKDAKYHDPNVWTDTTLYSKEEIASNNAAMWNITQYKLDYNVDITSGDSAVTDDSEDADDESADSDTTKEIVIPTLPVRDNSVQTVTVVSPSAITVVIKNNKVTQVETDNDLYTRNEFVYELSQSASTDMIITAFGIRQLRISDNEKNEIFSSLPDDMKLDLFKDLSAADQRLMVSEYDDEIQWYTFPISDAMSLYSKDDMLELFNALKSIDALFAMDGSRFDEYRLLVYLSKSNRADVNRYLKANYLTKSTFDDVVITAEEVIKVGNDIETLKTSVLQSSWNLFVDSDATYSCLVYDTDADFETEIEDIYDSVSSFYEEMKGRFPQL